MRIGFVLCVLVACSSRGGPTEDAGSDAATDATRDATSDAGTDASDAASDAPPDAFDAEAPDTAVDAGCEDDTPCDLDDDPCTRDACRDGECVAGAACVSPQMCDAELG